MRRLGRGGAQTASAELASARLQPSGEMSGHSLEKTKLKWDDDKIMSHENVTPEEIASCEAFTAAAAQGLSCRLRLRDKYRDGRKREPGRDLVGGPIADRVQPPCERSSGKLGAVSWRGLESSARSEAARSNSLLRTRKAKAVSNAYARRYAASVFIEAGRVGDSCSIGLLPRACLAPRRRADAAGANHR